MMPGLSPDMGLPTNPGHHLDPFRGGGSKTRPYQALVLLIGLLAPFALFAFGTPSLHAAEEPPKDPDALIKESADKLSKPEEPPSDSPISPVDAKPSRGEGEKALEGERSAVVPQFSLPEVVITGENKLTIGAERGDLQEDDVTRGSRDLLNLERSLDDLPGLNKTFTALTTEIPGPSKPTAFVLHAGGGHPGTYGGWGLLGHDFKDFQLLASGHLSAWAGEPAGGGLSRDSRYEFGGILRILPDSPLKGQATGRFKHLEAELPYQGSLLESTDFLDLGASGSYKVSHFSQVQAGIRHQAATLTYWDLGERNDRTEEWEGNLRWTTEDVARFLDRIVLDAGYRRADSTFPAPGRDSYDWGWVGLQVSVKHGENIDVTAKVQGQGGSMPGMDLRFFPLLQATWRVFEHSQIGLYWKTDRFIEHFQGVYRGRNHVSPRSGYPLPSEVTWEAGGRLTQKVLEKVVFSLSGSGSEIRNYGQWTDLDPGAPTYVQTYAFLPEVRLYRAGANLQWEFLRNWQAAATYQYTNGENLSGNGLGLTELPEHRGAFSLYRGDDKLEVRATLSALSERNSFDAAPGTLPSVVTFGLDSTYKVTQTFSLWLTADNLLGQDYQLQPGYPEPKYHVRGGIEVIL